VLVECDPDGGSLEYRFGQHPDPGLSSWAAACRAGRSAESLERHTQPLCLGVDVVIAPAGDAAAASVQTLAYADGNVFASAGQRADLVVDVGRVARGGPGLVVAGAADHLLVVVRPVLDELVQVQTRMPWLEQLPGKVWLVCAGPGPFAAKEIAEGLGAPVLGMLPHDERGAGVLSGQAMNRAWRRLPLPSAIAEIASALSRQARTPTRTGDGSTAPASAEMHR
jgi:hypothetical protein